MAPFPIRNPTPWTHYLACCIMTWYVSMYILSGLLERFAPKTYQWALDKAEEVKHGA